MTTKKNRTLEELIEDGDDEWYETLYYYADSSGCSISSWEIIGKTDHAGVEYASVLCVLEDEDGDSFSELIVLNNRGECECDAQKHLEYIAKQLSRWRLLELFAFDGRFEDLPAEIERLLA